MTLFNWQKTLIISLSLGLTGGSLPEPSLASPLLSLSAAGATQDAKASKKAEEKADKAAKKQEKTAQKVKDKGDKLAKKNSGKTDKVEKSGQSSASDEQQIRDHLAGITRSLAAGDSKGLSNLWATDATFIDSDGILTKGRDALEKKFALSIAESGRPHFLISPQNIRIVSNNVALSDGLVYRQDGITGPTPETRYSMVFVKQNGNWMISSATETPLAAEDSSPRIESLSWLIGDWTAENNGGVVHLKAEWAANKHFIVCRYEVKKTADATPVESRQVIGWDPRNEKIISWHFDSNGGYGYGSWVKRDKQWMISASGVQPDGSTCDADNIITLDGSNNGFDWQSINRSLNGLHIADTKPLKVVRSNKISSK